MAKKDTGKDPTVQFANHPILIFLNIFRYFLRFRFKKMKAFRNIGHIIKDLHDVSSLFLKKSNSTSAEIVFIISKNI